MALFFWVYNWLLISCVPHERINLTLHPFYAFVGWCLVTLVTLNLHFAMLLILKLGI